MTRHHTLAFLSGALLCAGVAAPPPALAQGAHEHGVSHLDVILDGSVLAIDFRGAGYHLAGFEHAPETGEQHAAWQATRDGLGDATALFTLPREANCSLQSAEVVAPAAGSHQQPGHGKADSDHHDHAKHHDHGHRHDHGHDRDHAHQRADDDHQHPNQSSADGHEHAHGADWQARYRFECANADRLTTIEVGLFTVFPAHEEVRYQRFSDGGQGGGTLTPGRTRLQLR
jgi:hypothetical protein